MGRREIGNKYWNFYKDVNLDVNLDLNRYVCE